MIKKRRVVVLLVVFFAFCSLNYLFQIYLPFVRENSAPGQSQLGTDSYLIWSPTRGFLLDKVDPYSHAASEQNQTWFYGAPLKANTNKDPKTFNYPLYTILLFTPFALFTFASARVLMLIVFTACTVCSLAMWLKVMHVRRSNVILGCVFAATSWPFAEALALEQPTLLVVFILSAAVYAILKSRFAVAGCLLALATIKPQVAWPCIAWLLLWAYFRDSSKRLIAGFLISLSILFALSEWLIRGWISEWIATIRNYPQYSGSRLSLQFIFGTYGGITMTCVLVLLAAMRLWRIRGISSESEDFGYSIALACALTLLLDPRGSWRSYDEVLLWPAAVYLLIQLKCFKRESAIVGLLHSSAIGLIFWPTICTAMLTGRRLLGADFNSESRLRAPTYGFFLVAPITVIALLLLTTRGSGIRTTVE